MIEKSSHDLLASNSLAEFLVNKMYHLLKQQNIFYLFKKKY